MGRNDYLGSTLTFDGFELAERAFAQRFLKPGMTVLDIGAHHGFHSLLASKLVGLTGKVFAFEPSPREQKALRFNLKLNLCENVRAVEIALGAQDSVGTLHVVNYQTGCNSLRLPSLPNAVSQVPVRVMPLDSWIGQQKLARVDFIKLDVEGAELDVLAGSKQLLEARPRPVILAEVQEVRTHPWGYHAKEILMHLQGKGYSWFRLLPDGTPTQLDLTAQEFDGNFLACPSELEPLSERLSVH